MRGRPGVVGVWLGMARSGLGRTLRAEPTQLRFYDRSLRRSSRDILRREPLLEDVPMKLHSFHLMPYADLPEDFKQKYRSVWVDVPSHLFDPAKAHDMYIDYLDELEYAAEMGFDGLCVNEHHQNAYGLMPSPNLMAATLARQTKDVGIVVLGNSLALYNPPTR